MAMMCYIKYKRCFLYRSIIIEILFTWYYYRWLTQQQPNPNSKHVQSSDTEFEKLIAEEELEEREKEEEKDTRMEDNEKEREKEKEHQAGIEESLLGGHEDIEGEEIEIEIDVGKED